LKTIAGRVLPVANHKSAIKRIRVNARRRATNRVNMSRVRTEVRKARESLAAKSANAEAVTREAMRILDKMVSNGTLHKNTAARRKSRLMKRLNALRAAN
jgi:small subunit ribosomal protein S20